MLNRTTNSVGPTSAAIVKYGPDGKSEAKHVNANYQGVAFDGSGAIIGGSLKFTASKPEDNITLSRSSAAFRPDGTPTSIASAINDRRTGAPYRNLNVDLSGVSYSVLNRVASGQMKFSTSRAEDGGQVADGAIAFATEQLSRLDVTHYLSDASGAVGGYSGISFANTQFLGDQILGGNMEISTLTPQSVLASKSTLQFSSDGLPVSMNTDAYDTNGTDVKVTILTNYQSAVFDPRKRIWSGQVTATTRDAQQRIRSHAVVTYANGSPASAINQTYDQSGQLAGWVETDFAGARFNNRNHVVNSAITVKSYRAGGSLLSSGTVQYDAYGNPITRNITAFRRDGLTEAGRTVVDYSAAIFDHHRKVVGGQVRSTATPSDGAARIQSVRDYRGSHRVAMKHVSLLNAAAGSPMSTQRTIYRPDGTLAEVTVQTGEKSASVTQYAPDGKTVIKVYSVDYSAANVVGGGVTGGSVAIQAQSGNQRPLSSSTLNY